MTSLISACGGFSNGVINIILSLQFTFFAVQIHCIIKRMDLGIQSYPRPLYDAFIKESKDTKNAGLFLNDVGKTETCKSACSWSLLYLYHRLERNPVVSFLLAIWCYCFSQTALDAAISGMKSIIPSELSAEEIIIVKSEDIQEAEDAQETEIISQSSTKEQPPPEQLTEEIATGEPIKIATDEPGDANESEDAKEDEIISQSSAEEQLTEEIETEESLKSDDAKEAAIISSILESYEAECDSIDIAQFRQVLYGIFSADFGKNDAIEKYINAMSEEQLKALLNMMLVAIKRDDPSAVIDLDFLSCEENANIPQLLSSVLGEGLTELATDSNIKFVDVLLWMEFFVSRSICEIKDIPRECAASGINNRLCAYGDLLERAICLIFDETTDVSIEENKTTINNAFSLLEASIIAAGDLLSGAVYSPIGDASQFITAYNAAIKCCVEQINVALRAEDRKEIAFESVQIEMPQQGNLPTSTKILQQVAVGRQDYSTLIDNAERFLQDKKLVGIARAQPMLSLLNCLLLPKIGIALAGAGLVSKVYRVTTDAGKEVYIRKIGSKAVESEAFANATVSIAFEEETLENPNVEGRYTAASAIGDMFHIESGGKIQSPTVHATVSEDQAGVRVLEMDKAGSRTLRSCDVTKLSSAQIERMGQIQLFKLIIGDLDFNPGNAMIDDDTGSITSIDHGASFPPGEWADPVDALLRKIKCFEQKRIGGYRDAFKYVVLNVPPVMTKLTHDTTLAVLSDENIAKIVKMLQDEKFSDEEINATEKRARLIKSKLENDVKVVDTDEEVAAEFRNPESVFNGSNSTLKRFDLILRSQRPA
jgi:hypothetical protein